MRHIDNDNLMKIRTKIREEREKRNLSLRDMEERTGIIHSTLQRIETGEKKGLDVQQLEKIANALGMDISDFFDSKEKIDEGFVLYLDEMEKHGLSIDDFKKWIEEAKGNRNK